jgi:hypothetical protein
MAYNTFMNRAGAAAELPQQLAEDLITGTVRESAALQMGRKIITSTRDSRIPVLSALPQAYWLSPSDSGLGQTTAPVISNQVMIVEEVMALAVIPNTIIEDSEFPIWAELQPLLVQSLAKAVDQAVLFGNNAPGTFSASVAAHATAAGNVLPAAVFTAGFDNAGALMGAAQLVSQEGYNCTGAAVAPGWQWRAGAARTAALVANPLGADSPFPLLLGGMPIKPDPLTWALPGGPRSDTTGTTTTNGSTTVGDTHAVAADVGIAISGVGIPTGTTVVSVTPGTGYVISNAATATGTPTLTVGAASIDAIVGQWDLLVVGVRRDFTMTMFDSGVITDNNGVVTYNLIQQDASAVRVTARIGAYIASPPTDYQGPKSPFALVTNSGTVGPVGLAEDEAPVKTASKR